VRSFIDFREYLPHHAAQRFRVPRVRGYSDGDFPQPFYFGGFDTVRGFEFRELVGDRAFYTNLEWRFPLIDLLATPVFAFQGIRGRIFLDVGGAWFDDIQHFQFYNSDEEAAGERGGVVRRRHHLPFFG
jgi:hemolysin activation/secretion protein